eukprot:1680373-Amphidinium_carterae.1
MQRNFKDTCGTAGTGGTNRSGEESEDLKASVHTSVFQRNSTWLMLTEKWNSPSQKIAMTSLGFLQQSADWQLELAWMKKTEVY